MSKELEKKYLAKDGKVNEKALYRDATPLPAPIGSLVAFADQFGTRNNYQGQTGDVRFSLNVIGAFNHLIENTYNEDRNYISGALYDFLHNPMFIVKTPDGHNFYKPYKEGEQTVHLMSLHIDNNGIAEMKTFYELSSLKKVERLIRTPERNIVYSQHLGYTRPLPKENAGNLSNTSGLVNGDPNISSIIPQNSQNVKTLKMSKLSNLCNKREILPTLKPIVSILISTIYLMLKKKRLLKKSIKQHKKHWMILKTKLNLLMKSKSLGFTKRFCPRTFVLIK